MNRRIANTRDAFSTDWVRCGPRRAAHVPLAGWLIAGIVLGGVCALPAPTRAQDMKPETLEKVKHATVMVWTRASRSKKGDTKLGSGSGYFINSTGLVITNNHVVDPGHGKSPREKWQLLNKYNLLVNTVVTDAGTDAEQQWECDLLYQNEQADQALLQVLNLPFTEKGKKEDESGPDGTAREKLEWPYFLHFLPESQLSERLKLVALGFPGGDSRKSSKGDFPEVNVVEGHVIELPRTPAGRVRRIYTDAEVRAGNSGGPMVTVDGFLVGTLTLGIGNPERRNYNALVPGALTREFIRAAFDLGKVPDGTDCIPFMEMLTQEDGRLHIPEFARLRDSDILYFANGDRVHSDIATDQIVWTSPLGKLKVSAEAVAYVMNNVEGQHLFLEGGNRITSSDVDLTFEFTPQGGTRATQKFSDVQTVAFRTSDRRLEPVSGKIIILDSELTHLRLMDVEGAAKFETQWGAVDVKLDQVDRIETSDMGERVLITSDGQRLTGRFGDGGYKAKIADTQTPIEFGLGEVEELRVEILTHRPHEVEGLGIAEVLMSADRDVQRILETLVDSGDAQSARSQVEAVLESSEFKRMPDVKKEQIELLTAEAALRSGDAEAAPKLFRGCTRADNENIRVYATACHEVLKRFDDFTYQGAPLSDRGAFVAAGSLVADEYIREVGDVLKDGEHLEGERRAEYVRGISDVRKYEDPMKAATVFRGVDAEDELFRLWRFAIERCQYEIWRIDRELEELQGKGKGKGKGKASKKRRGKRSGQASQRQIDDLNEQREKVLETYAFYQRKLDEAGFRIEDPDIRKKKEREEDEEEPGEDPDDEEGP